MMCTYFGNRFFQVNAVSCAQQQQKFAVACLNTSDATKIYHYYVYEVFTLCFDIIVHVSISEKSHPCNF